MKSRKLILSAVVLTSMYVEGCMLGPTYQAPEVTTSTSWKETPATESPAPMIPESWWTLFKDPGLDIIENEVIAANQDLQRAASRVAEARALARMSEADLYPHFAVSDSHTRFRPSGNQETSLGKARAASDHHLALDLGYEVDLWGRVRRGSEAARADAAAIADDAQALRLALTADAARHYFQLRSLDAEKRVLQSTLELRRDATRLQEERNRAGLINEVDVSRARTELATVEAEMHAVIRARARLEHALAVLCGKAPAGFAIAIRETSFALPEIPAGLPSMLLQRRPDLAASENQMRAACARIGVAKADFFPRISLTGAAGFASGDLSTLTDSGSRLWSFGPSLNLPIFEGGRNQANLAAARARYEQSISTYRGTVLTAFREVEDALSDLSALSAQTDAANRAFLAASDTAGLAEERYQRGLSNYLDVVDAQRAALQAERQVIQLRSERTLSTVFLAKALGGGWQPAERIAGL